MTTQDTTIFPGKRLRVAVSAVPVSDRPVYARALGEDSFQYCESISFHNRLWTLLFSKGSVSNLPIGGIIFSLNSFIL